MLERVALWAAIALLARQVARHGRWTGYRRLPATCGHPAPCRACGATPTLAGVIADRLWTGLEAADA